MFIYSSDYYAELRNHVFPIGKYRDLYTRLRDEAKISEAHFLAPEPASDEQILLVHTSQYLSDLRGYKHTERTRHSEMPISRQIIEAAVLNTGGSIQAAREALRSDGFGVCMNIGGGFHHAFPDHAEGFCYLNDVAISVRCVKQESLAARVLIVDLDLHQGNGTAAIFQHDPDVFTFSMHQETLYPKKERSSLDIGLDMEVGDERYLELLSEALPRILDQHKPDLVVYLAGADPYEHDQLGNLRLTIDGLKSRDKMVYDACRSLGVPVATFLAGGYARSVSDTVTIHYSTCLEMMRHFRHQVDYTDRLEQSRKEQR